MNIKMLNGKFQAKKKVFQEKEQEQQQQQKSTLVNWELLALVMFYILNILYITQ